MKTFVIFRACGNNFTVYGVTKKGDGSVQSATHVTDYPEINSVGDIIAFGIASTGKYMMTCNDTTKMIIWNMKGAVLANVETNLLKTYCAVVSPCGRFVGASGFTSEVKVWSVVFEKTGEFKSVSKAFDLKGHTAAIPAFAFSNDASRMATVSKDNTWKLWETNGQDANVLLTGSCKLDARPTLMSISPDARVVAIVTGEQLRLYSAKKGTEEEVINHEEQIKCIRFDPLGKQLAVAVSLNIFMYHNVIGYRVGIEDLEEELLKAKGESTKERIRKQIDEARFALKKILKERLK